MQVKDSNKTFNYVFDTFQKGQELIVHYDFYFESNNCLDHTEYEVDILSINLVGSDVDIHWILDDKLVNQMIEYIIDAELDHSQQCLQDNYDADYERRFAYYD